MTTDDGMMMKPIEREPAWLTAAVDQTIAQMKGCLAEAGATLPSAHLIMVMLNDHETSNMSEPEFMQWNEMCDGCRRQFNHAVGLLYCFTLRDWDTSSKACITFAACLDCLAKP